MKPRPFHDLVFDLGVAFMQQEVSVNRLRQLEAYRPAYVTSPINRITKGESDAAS